MSFLPKPGKGRRCAAKEAEYQRQLRAFVATLLEIESSLDFKIGTRGWCYQLESHGLLKSDFDQAEILITKCRKNGLLPLDICAEDDARQFDAVEILGHDQPEDEAQSLMKSLDVVIDRYRPFSFWADKSVYIQVLVEKVDLKNLFLPVCERYDAPIANQRGWPDLNMRAAMMRRFRDHEAEGRQCVLLYCGDFDPAGLHISESLKAMLEDLSAAVCWHPDNLIVDRFGLNFEFIEKHGLTWIDNLMTGGKSDSVKGKGLDNPEHPDHTKPYVQDYLGLYGARKVEANALVARPEAGRQLCERAILKYLGNAQAPEEYVTALQPYRDQLRVIMGSQLAGDA